MKTLKSNPLRDAENELALKCVTVLSGIVRPEVLRMIFPHANLCALKHVCASVNARNQKQTNQTTV